MSSQPRRVPIETTLFGFLISLALKGALDTGYGHAIPNISSPTEMMDAIVVPASLLIAVFLITLLRFVYGVYRFNDEFQEAVPQLKSWAQLWNIAAAFILFVFFYLTGLSIQHSGPFYVGLIVVHAWDLIWFFSIVWTHKLREGLKEVIERFIIIDIATIAAISLAMSVFTDAYRGKVAGLMLLLAIGDVLWNRRFFLDPAGWRALPHKQIG